MQTAIECIPCFVRQAAEAVELCAADAADRERLLRRLLADLAETDWATMPVAITQRMQRLLRSETGQSDPYRSVKDRMNRIALELLPAMEQAIRSHTSRPEALARLAIAGNLLDSGAKTRLEPEELPQRLGALWAAPLIGSAEEMFRAAEAARNILFLADNAGEIVFDRLLVEAMPAGRVTIAVRGSPVINDATIEDAEAAGLTGLAPVITNGSDAPGTIIEECSAEFRACFERADLVIAKGQGNFETLCESDKDIFFLLTVKCPPVARLLGARVGDMVIRRMNGRSSGPHPEKET